MSASITFQQAVDNETKKIKQQMKRRSLLASNALRSEALQVLSGARGGRSYRVLDKKERRYRVPATKKYYTASDPGEPPAVRTGAFRDSWRSKPEQSGNTYISRIESALTVNGYLLGELLENGTSKMASRPYVEKIKQQALPRITQIYSAPFT